MEPKVKGTPAPLRQEKASSPPIPPMEEVRRLADLAQAHQVKDKDDFCVGIYRNGGDELLVYSEDEKNGFCVVGEIKISRIGYLPEKVVRVFIQKYLNPVNQRSKGSAIFSERSKGGKDNSAKTGSTGGSGTKNETSGTKNLEGPDKGEKRAPKILSRSDLSLSKESLERVVRSCPSPEGRARAEILKRDHLFRAHADKYIEKGISNAEIERRFEEEAKSVLPDGRVIFWEKSTARKVADILLGSNELVALIASRWYQFRNEMNEIEKKEFLENTFEERAAMADAFRFSAEQYALSHHKEELNKIWTNNTYSLPEKKEIFFNLWDECLEDVSGALQIRQSVLSFIQTHLPQGSSKAYTREELSRLNAKRTSRARFDPYS